MLVEASAWLALLGWRNVAGAEIEIASIVRSSFVNDVFGRIAR
jgi:hypothetical protein